MNYVAVMSNSIKQYKYSTEAFDMKDGLQELDSNLRSLEAWDRRCIQTMHKLRSIITFIKQRTSDTSELELYSPIIEDYEYITEMVNTYGRRLETMVPVLTSVVQIADTRRSLREATNVTRLTNLALLFVPLSFVTGPFGMNYGCPSIV
jgi:Mg2+ and Co2+ transporter CorA